MRRGKYVFRRLVAITVIATLLLALPATVMADGGPIVQDLLVWRRLSQGQQIAVVRLGESDTAHVDLFISLLDESGESHEIVFFLPLGVDSTAFSVVEETSADFESALTREYEHIISQNALRTSNFKRYVYLSLLPGTLSINGGWSWPLLSLLLLSGCGPARAPAPIATYETESSQIALYGINEDTNLQALISTTGLDPAVEETLSRLEGQQIAVITIQTQPTLGQGAAGGRSTGQPGLHLAWTTTLVSHSREATYAYPLGTGSAWANPIEVTRVYVVAPPGVDFTTHYPRLGRDFSGFTGRGLLFGTTRPRILDADGPAYAVENVVGDFGRIWRVTYLDSNSAEDIHITRLLEMSPETLAALRRLQFQRIVLAQTPLVSLISVVVALALWLVAWRYTMPRLLGMEYRWSDFKLWRDALGWALLYPLTNGAVLAVAALLASITAGVSFLIGAPLLFITLLGVVSIFFFVRWSSRTLGVSQGRAGMAYIVVILIANVVYLIFAIGYTALVGAL